MEVIFVNQWFWDASERTKTEGRLHIPAGEPQARPVGPVSLDFQPTPWALTFSV